MPQHRQDDDAFASADPADRAEQQRAVADDETGADEEAPDLPLEADPADVAEQGIAVPYDDEDDGADSGPQSQATRGGVESGRLQRGPEAGAEHLLPVGPLDGHPPE